MHGADRQRYEPVYLLVPGKRFTAGHATSDYSQLRSRIGIETCKLIFIDWTQDARRQDTFNGAADPTRLPARLNPDQAAICLGSHGEGGNGSLVGRLGQDTAGLRPLAD